MHELKILDLTNGTRLTDRSLDALAKGCTKLERLNLSGCLGITEIGLVSLGKSCTNLRQLNLCGCDGAATDKALTVIPFNFNLNFYSRNNVQHLTSVSQWLRVVSTWILC
jgi:hypothetical protein